ncbi:MAG: hypothetical protein ABW005_03695 [Burkholderiaceae bacterium]
MRRSTSLPVRLAALVLPGLSLLLQPALARAECSRPLQAPVAPTGLSVTTTGQAVGGLYPELLRGLLAKEGCEIEFSVVPRARQEAMFEAGRGDLLIPATRTARRDGFGLFVPMVSSRATVISLSPERPPLRSLAELRQHRELRVVLVRGYDYGKVYQELQQELAAQKRLVLAVDAISVARVLNGGMADLTIMAPSILIGALQGEAHLRFLQERLRVEPVQELPWGESGIYISSHAALDEKDRALLREALERGARSGEVWRAFQRFYPPGSLTESIKPRY